MRRILFAIVPAVLVALAFFVLPGFAQDNKAAPTVITHHSVPVMIRLTLDDGTPISLTVLLNVESQVEEDRKPGDPAVRVNVTPKRSESSEGSKVSGVEIGAIQSANFVALEPTPAPAAEGGLLPTPTPGAGEASAATGAAVTEGPRTNDAANIRSGPGTTFSIVGSAAAGSPLEITGRTADGKWYQLDGKRWVAAFLVDDAPAGVPVITDLPGEPVAAATATVTATATITATGSPGAP